MSNMRIDSNAKKFKILITTVAVTVAMGMSAAAGAWMQFHIDKKPVLSAEQEQALSEQAARDSSYLRQNVNELASKVGTLQARLIAMDNVSKRVADVAGVAYTDPEVAASLEPAALPTIMDDIGGDAGAAWSAEGLGRQVDLLAQRISEQKDWLSMLDLVLTKRAGVEASLPTLQPVDYPYLSSSFGWRRHPVTGRHSMHEGLDFAAPKGTPIHAASGGVITEARYVPGYGKMVEINHGNGLVTRYAHASSINVKLGDLVEKGHMVARVGSTGRSTGPHLHFEVRMAGHPLDPTLFFQRQNTPDALLADAASELEPVGPQVR